MSNTNQNTEQAENNQTIVKSPGIRAIPTKIFNNHLFFNQNKNISELNQTNYKDPFQVLEFFKTIIHKFSSEKTFNKQTKFIVVYFMLPTFNPFYQALKLLGNVEAVIPKGSKNLKVYNRFKPLFDKTEITRKDLSNQKDIQNYINSHVLPNEEYMILDIGGYFAPGLPYFDTDKRCKGIIEVTQNGLEKYQKSLGQNPSLSLPIVSLAQSFIKSGEDEQVGKGIVSAVDNILKEKSYNSGNERLEPANHTAGVIGYGKIGKSIARELKKRGFTVLVHDISIRAQYSAISEELKVCSKEDVLRNSDVLFLATGKGSLKEEKDFLMLKNNVKVALATSADDEINEEILKSNIFRCEKYDNVTYYKNIISGHTFEILYSGLPTNFKENGVDGTLIHAVQAQEIVCAIRVLQNLVPPQDSVQIPNSDDEEKIIKEWLNHFCSLAISNKRIDEINTFKPRLYQSM